MERNAFYNMKFSTDGLKARLISGCFHEKWGDGFIQIVNLIVLYGSMISIAYHDVKERKIYNSTLIFMVLVRVSMFLANFFNSDFIIPLKENIIAAFGIFLLFFCMKLANPSGVGMGDVKLAFVLGLYLGYSVLGVMGTAVFFLFCYAIFRKEKKQIEHPFAPFVLAAMVLMKVFDMLLFTRAS